MASGRCTYNARTLRHWALDYVENIGLGLEGNIAAETSVVDALDDIDIMLKYFLITIKKMLTQY